MEQNIKLLKERFEEIKKKGWIKGDKHNIGSVGLLFEEMIGKENENFELPDFCGIEIKVKSKSPMKNMSLFCCAPDSYLMEVYRLWKTYGYPDKEYKNFNIFYAVCSSKKKTKLPNGYKVMLYVNYKLRIVELIIYDKDSNLIDDKASWSFDLLKEKLYRKLSYLAFVDANSKNEHEKKYHKYNDISFYKLKNFETFIKLLAKGKIQIVFQVGIKKSGTHFGEKYDHGTAFVISKYDLHYLFKKIEEKF